MVQTGQRHSCEVRCCRGSVDESEESHFRFLVDGKTVKYVTIVAGLYAVDDPCFAPTLLSLLPAFPDREWNDGYIARSMDSGVPFFARTIKRRLPTIRSGWHSTYVSHLEFSFRQNLRSGVYEDTAPRLQVSVVVKFARFAWEIPALDRECKAYRWIEGQDTGRRFLGFLVEKGRIIGFIIERMIDARHATPTELRLCQKTFSKLHKLGILHGDVNKNNFLVKGGRPIVIDFECARVSEDKPALREKIECLSNKLGDTSGKGGNILFDRNCSVQHSSDEAELDWTKDHEREPAKLSSYAAGARSISTRLACCNCWTGLCIRRRCVLLRSKTTDLLVISSVWRDSAANEETLTRHS